MTVFQNKNLVKAFLEKKNQARKNGFRLRQKKLWHQNQYRNLNQVSVVH